MEFELVNSVWAKELAFIFQEIESSGKKKTGKDEGTVSRFLFIPIYFYFLRVLVSRTRERHACLAQVRPEAFTEYRARNNH